MKHGSSQGHSELLEKVCVGLRYGYPRAETREHGVVTLNALFKVDRIEQISLPERDAISKFLESIRRANQRRHRMTAFDRLLDDLDSCAACGSQYNQLHISPLNQNI